jgi:hypothetical protein
MDANALPAAGGFQPLPAPGYHGATGEARHIEAWESERGRLPTGVAYPIILLLSVGAWALMATIALWLYRALG